MSETVVNEHCFKPEPIVKVLMSERAKIIHALFDGSHGVIRLWTISYPKSKQIYRVFRILNNLDGAISWNLPDGTSEHNHLISVGNDNAVFHIFDWGKTTELLS